MQIISVLLHIVNMKNILLDKFGHRLKELRKIRGITQEQLAEIVDVHQTYIGKLEVGMCNPSLELLERIVKALDTDLHTFFNF